VHCVVYVCTPITQFLDPQLCRVWQILAINQVQHMLILYFARINKNILIQIMQHVIIIQQKECFLVPGFSVIVDIWYLSEIY
jgi:hypothetical protein